MPVSGLQLTPVQANSDVVVLPRAMAPASANRPTTGASTVSTLPFSAWEPRSVGIPAVWVRSLIVTGRPKSAPSSSPRISAASGAYRRLPRPLGAERREGVDAGLAGLDARQHRVDQLDG